MKEHLPVLSSPLSELRSSQVELPDSGAFFRKPPRKPKHDYGAGRKTRSQKRLSSDEDDEPVKPASTRKALANFADLGSGNETSDESDVARPPVRRRLRTASSPVAAPDTSSSEEDDTPRTLQKRSKAPSRNVVEVSSESELESSPNKRRHVVTREERQEIEDDLKDLASSSSGKLQVLSRLESAYTKFDQIMSYGSQPPNSQSNPNVSLLLSGSSDAEQV